MDREQMEAARQCRAGAEDGSMTFPQGVGRLSEAGFESYGIDFRRATAAYYLPDGESIELATHRIDVPVAARFDAAALQEALREAQTLAPGYSYKGFCRKAKAAGCAGYLVSFLGRRVLYYGRTGETHVEMFPPAE